MCSPLAHYSQVPDGDQDVWVVICAAHPAAFDPAGKQPQSAAAWVPTIHATRALAAQAPCSQVLVCAHLNPGGRVSSRKAGRPGTSSL
jgi:hypothetical protein